MLTSNDLLRSYLRLIRDLSGAEAVSVYLPAVPEVSESSLLLHEGREPAVPELADVAAAEDLAGSEEADSPGDLPLILEPSRAPAGRLVRVRPDVGQEAGGDAARRRRRTDRHAATLGPPAMYLGLRFAREAEAPPPDAVLGDDEALRLRVVELGAALASHCHRVDAVLLDPVSELPGRADFQAALFREVAASDEEEHPLALVLVNPDDFTVVNERFGSDAGDAVVREIAQRLRGALRRSDLVHRYGGVVFAAILPDTQRADATAVAEKLRSVLTDEGYLDGAVRLGFNLGLASLEGTVDEDRPEDAAWELLRQADRALNKARRSSHARVVAWRPGARQETAQHRDRLSGIFTADLAKDYRNMLLLWDTVDMMTAAASPGELASRAVELLAATFKPDRALLFRLAEAEDEKGRELEVAASHGGRDADAPQNGEPALRDAERALIDGARFEARLIEGRIRPTEPGGSVDYGYALPLVSRGECLGCLYLAGPAQTLTLDASDLIFLKALAGQLAAALDRAELAARQSRHKEQESRRLRAELDELRGALEETRLVYSSPQIGALLETVRRVAPTDATVLVTGLSGTGKELVARTVHALSPRRDKPPVVVDCAAISASLIDSELFGHERGAYTGAGGRTVGRLAEAADSTLILDEIGELPLEVQAKLLRFVQEKQITPVGGTRPRTVDVRLVAVTNRDLEEEVAAGRFRADLFYRLKVVHVEVPALAERPEDVPLLIDHFLQRFSTRYGKEVRGLSREAAALAARHSWPGNVRELENRILQAVILCEGDEIGPQDLDLVEAVPVTGPATLDLDLGQLEKRHIQRVLESEDGSVARAARRLGIQRNTLYQKIKKYGLER